MRSSILSRRRGLLSAAVIAAAAAVLPSSAFAEAPWPNRAIKLVVPFAAGGSSDIIARVLATKLSARLGQPVVMENKGGAGGNLGIDSVAKSPADGYTLLFGSATISTSAASGAKLPYDALKDLDPIGEIGRTPLVVVVAKDVKAATLRELLDAAREQPGRIRYGSGGIGSMSHLGAELLASEAKVQMMHVPYRGISLSFNDLLGGNLQMTVSAFATVAKLVESGRLRALAVTSPQRSPFMPNLPTVAESGLPGFQIEFWWGLFGPANMPPAIVKRLNDELHTVLAMPEVREMLAHEATTPKPGTPQALGKLLSSDVARWSKLVKDANIKPE